MYWVRKRTFRVLIVNILLKKYFNIFEIMEIAESIYEGVVENS